MMNRPGKFTDSVLSGRGVYFPGERTYKRDLGGTVDIPVCVPATACRGRRVPVLFAIRAFQ